MSRERLPQITVPENADEISGIRRRVESIEARSELADLALERIDRALESSALSKEERTHIRSQAAVELTAVQTSLDEKKEKGKKTFLETIRQKFASSPFAKALIVAAGLHAPVFSMKVFDRVKETAEHIKELPRVIKPQSYETMLRVMSETAEREKKIDKQKLADFKKAEREKQERGEESNYGEMRLNLEKLNGVDTEEVERAEKISKERIEKFTAKAESGITESFLREFVDEMYGNPSNYEWDQASMVKYFNTGKRNCVAITQAQTLVLDGVIHQLPVDQQKKYEVGKTIVKEHEYATVTVKEANGDSTTYELDGHVRVLKNKKETAGSKNVPLDTLKKGMVAEKPIKLAAAQDGSEIKSSPDLIVTTNQPVNDGVEVEGPLRASDFVMQEVEREGLQIQVQQAVDVPSTMEITSLHEEQEIDNNVEKARELRQTAEEEGHMGGKFLDVTQLSSPKVEVIRELNHWQSQDPFIISYGNLDQFSDQAVDEVLKTPAIELVIDFKGTAPRAEGDFSNMGSMGGRKLAQALERAKGKKLHFKRLNLFNVEALQGAGPVWSFFVQDNIKEYGLDNQMYDWNDIGVINNHPGKVFHLRHLLAYDHRYLNPDGLSDERVEEIFKDPDYAREQEALINDALKVQAEIRIDSFAFKVLLNHYPQILTGNIYPEEEGMQLGISVETYEDFLTEYEGPLRPLAEKRLADLREKGRNLAEKYKDSPEVIKQKFEKALRHISGAGDQLDLSWVQDPPDEVVQNASKDRAFSAAGSIIIPATWSEQAYRKLFSTRAFSNIQLNMERGGDPKVLFKAYSESLKEWKEKNLMPEEDGHISLGQGAYRLSQFISPGNLQKVIESIPPNVDLDLSSVVMNKKSIRLLAKSNVKKIIFSRNYFDAEDLRLLDSGKSKVEINGLGYAALERQYPEIRTMKNIERGPMG
jgi:hypothetical protein